MGASAGGVEALRSFGSGRPADLRLLVLEDLLALAPGSTENGHRLAVKAQFRSTAVARGPAVIGVLSEVLSDGVAGMVAIAARGGV